MRKLRSVRRFEIVFARDVEALHLRLKGRSLQPQFPGGAVRARQNAPRVPQRPNNVLTLSGERKFEDETKKENYLRVERSFGNFTRSFTLPPFVDAKKITAEFKDGLLEVKLPKMEAARPKEVEIKVK